MPLRTAVHNRLFYDLVGRLQEERAKARTKEDKEAITFALGTIKDFPDIEVVGRVTSCNSMLAQCAELLKDTSAMPKQEKANILKAQAVVIELRDATVSYKEKKKKKRSVHGKARYRIAVANRPPRTSNRGRPRTVLPPTGPV